LIIAFAGVPWTYGIDCITYLASLIAIRALPKLPPLGEVRPAEPRVDSRGASGS